MQNKFNLRLGNKQKFSMKINTPMYGWIRLSFFNNKKKFFFLSASGVYNPFYDLVDFLKKISLNKNGTYEWEVDQEGYYGIMTATVKGKLIHLETKTDISDRGRERRKSLPDFKITYNKKDFLRTFICHLENNYMKNKRVIHNDCYDLSYDIISLRKIKI